MIGSLSFVESTMTDLVRPRVKYVIGPDGSPLTIADLPPSNTRRWVIRRKAEVVAAVRGGLLSLEEACERYALTVEEFLSWQSSINDHGLAGLRVVNQLAAGPEEAVCSQLQRLAAPRRVQRLRTVVARHQ